MNDVSVFTNDRFGNLRTVNIDDSHWFVGKDVALALGYSNTKKALSDHVDPEDKMNGVTIRDSIGRPQSPVLINESGLYSLVLSSKLPSAKAFKHWVTHDVLPAIRKTGAYVVPSLAQQLVSDPDTLYLIVEQLRQERTARLVAEEQAKSACKQLLTVQQRIEDIHPYPAFIFSDDPDAQYCCSVSTFAKQISCRGKHSTPQKLFSWFRRHGYIQQHSPLPTSHALETGYFIIMEKRSGRSRYYTSAITLSGQLYFSSLFE